MPKLTQSAIKARISRAIVGFQIPLLEIPKLYTRLENGVKADLSDDDLKTIVAAWPGVKHAA